MNESDITQIGDDVLRKKAQPVALAEITGEKIKAVITDMKSALADTDDGVAIAAPQIGVSLRMFLVRGEVFRERGDVEEKDKIFINPEIVNKSSKTVTLDEGCLSVRDVYGKIERATQATVRAYNETGAQFEMGGGGILAQIFQHETDHLDGTLFVDKARDLREIDRTEGNQKKDA